MTNPALPLAAEELAQLAQRTLDHYRRHARAFREGTRDHDVSQNIAALLQHIVGPRPFTILDLGCGPGRDLATFTQLGHRAVGLDGAAPFVTMARADTGCEVWQQDFLKLDLPGAISTGSSPTRRCFMSPTQELPRVLRELHAALKPKGVLFSSNPRGNDEAGWDGGRFGVYHCLETWRRFVTEAGFAELMHYYRPAGLPCAQQPWLATVWRRLDDGNTIAVRARE